MNHSKNNYTQSFHNTMTSAFVGQFIYLIQEREFVNSGENVFKVGRSSQLINRISSYPKGSNVIFAVKVSDAVIAETSVLQKLRNSNDVIQRKDIGSEYFQGYEMKLISIVTHVCATIDYPSKLISKVCTDSDDTCKIPKIITKGTRDPVILVNQYLESNIEHLKGKTMLCTEFYNTCMQFWDPNTILNYTQFAAILAKSMIVEKRQMHGPVFVFPREDPIDKFIEDCIIRDPKSFFTIKMAQAAYEDRKYYKFKSNFKAELQTKLDAHCIKQITYKQTPYHAVIKGYKLVSTCDEDDCVN